MNPVRILDNGIDISNSVLWSTIDFVSQLTKDVGVGRFSVMQNMANPTGVNVPVIGDLIQLYDSSGLIWAGTVTETEATIEGLLLTWAVTVTDWGYSFNGVLVKKNYAQMDPHDIVLDIVANFAAGKGFTTNHVQKGNFLIPSIKFNYQQPSKALQSLANLIGWDWYIDPNKDIHFFLGDVDDGVGEGGVAPIVVDDTGGNTGADKWWNSLDVDVNITTMQNSVYVIGGTYTKTFTAANTVDTFLTDGVTQFFSVSYAYESDTDAYDTTPMVVTLDGVSQTIGIANQDDPADFQVSVQRRPAVDSDSLPELPPAARPSKYSEAPKSPSSRTLQMRPASRPTENTRESSQILKSHQSLKPKPARRRRSSSSDILFLM